ncbi:NAD(P)-dependent dehydrogenase (short-subunit alcohol dehydrogenase family) [Salibacterium salarium]|uniref:SDR family NAD(P)-dependent oxidoreductase n=1 Tax=Salibacterium salarium TaxID=284579 RepID=UPI0027836617|nr:glucose 1-dehydrogenase [Salibacterium salarium]MDQ0300082.1 NAD(P)-dependent dehydrogenase (short-subunit alcohol dehydrogenase family) [Salibacterium salarium]
MSDYNNKTAIITGGGSGIGRQTALSLARKGANVTIADISEEAGEESVRLIEELGRKAIFVKTDVSNLEDVKAYVKKTKETFGSIDMFFNNAGIEGKVTPLADYPEDIFEKVVDINLKGAFYGLKYVIQEMLQNGGGAIVNTASNAALDGSPGVSPYSATKHSIVGLTKTAAGEYASQNIRVNAIAPGPTATNMMDRFTQGSEEAADQVKSGIPANRYGTPEEVANLVTFLLGSDVNFTNGAVFPIDGGITSV